MVAMPYTKEQVIDILRRAGLREAADEAVRDLPDPVDLDHLEEWAMRHGLTRDFLISQMGGSP